MRSTNGKEQILRAAQKTFADKGYDGASIRGIAQEAGLSLSALYYYFPSKQDALFTLISRAYITYNTRTKAILASVGKDNDTQLAYLVRHLVNYRCKNITSSKVVLAETERLEGERYTRVRELQSEARELLSDIVEAGDAAGDFNVPNTTLTSRSIYAICNAIPQWYQPGGRFTPEILERDYVEAALRLVGSKHAGSIEQFFEFSSEAQDPVDDVDLLPA